MNRYIDAEKLKSAIKAQINERKNWMKDADKSDRQDQLWSDLNGEDMSIIQIINSLQQERSEVDIRKELGRVELMGSNDARDMEHIARHFYELGLNARKEE